MSEDREEVIGYLRSLGATEAEIDEAEAGETYGELALDLTLRPAGAALSFAEAAQQAGLDADTAARLWRAFGFPDPTAATPRVAPDMVDALKLFAAAAELLGPDAALALARVLGSSTARLAGAIVDSFRVNFEVPQLQSGTPYSDVLKSYVGVAESLVPAAFDALGAVLRRHMLDEARGTWSVDEENAATSRNAAVGFVDLVAFTALSRTLTNRQLTAVVSGFEEAVTEVVSGHSGRVVKLIGDGAMFVADDAATACRLGLALIERVAADPALPPVRVGLAYGAVVGLHGDYFGNVVNLAARLVAVAAPSTVTVSEAVVEGAAAAGLVAEALAPSSLKGIPEVSTAFRVSAP